LVLCTQPRAEREGTSLFILGKDGKVVRGYGRTGKAGYARSREDLGPVENIGR
jgi:hypothetical protein